MPRAVILDHDGGFDDLVALSLLLANPDVVTVIGCVCTNADCFVENAFDVTGKLMCLLHKRMDVPLFPIGMSSLRGVNAFPSEWRCHAKNMDDMPSLNIPECTALWKDIRPRYVRCAGERLLAELVINFPEKVTICVTGPLSNVAWCIEMYGEMFTKKVEKCIIMGGAVDVGGNVFQPNTNGTAEWNIYWDPPAARVVLGCPDLCNVLFTLDSTNAVPVCSSVVQRFGAQNDYLLSQFVGSAWAMCTHYELLRPGDGYYAWDVLAAAYTLHNSLAEVEPVTLEVEVDKTESEGRTSRSQKEGPCTLVAKNVRVERFYELVYSSMCFC